MSNEKSFTYITNWNVIKYEYIYMYIFEYKKLIMRLYVYVHTKRKII